MKLYFYKFKTSSFDGLKIETGECEVTEKPKTYYPVGKFPPFFYGSYVNKYEIDKLSGYCSDTVILTEKDDKKAFDLFMGKIVHHMESMAIEMEQEQNKKNFLNDWIGK